MSEDIYAVAASFRRNLLKNDRRTVFKILAHYAHAANLIRPRIEELTRAVEAAQSAGAQINVAWFQMQRDRLLALDAQIKNQMDIFASKAGMVTTAAQGVAVEKGFEHAQALIKAASAGQAVRTNPGAQLNTRAVEALIGFASDGSPLKDLYAEISKGATNRIVNRFLQGVTQGKSPRFIAQQINQDLGLGAARAATIARTETLRAYREATRANFADNSDVVKGYIWVSQMSSRTCALCWALTGKKFDTDVPFATHPNCRCTMIPITDDPSFVIQSGEERLRQMSEGDQRAILGTGKYDAWRRGEFSLGAVVGTKRDDRWGVQRYERSLRDIRQSPHPVEPIIPRIKLAVESDDSEANSSAIEPKTLDAGQKTHDSAEVKYRDVSQALRVEGEKVAVGRALRAIDKVHTDGVLPEIPVSRSYGRVELGSYGYHRDGSAAEIKVSAKGAHKELTATHEVGHFLDHQGVNTTQTQAGQFATMSRDPLMAGFKDAAAKSQAITRLREALTRPTIEFESADGVTRTYRVDRKYVQYLLSEDEIWARAYAQYIAVRSGDSVMLGQLSEQQKPTAYPNQWAHDDFPAIAAEIDKIFKVLGWLK